MTVPVPPPAIDRTRVATLRYAAAAIREQNIPGRGYSDDTLLAVADWLDACALVVTAAPSVTKAHADRVARAYPGDAA